MKTPEKFPFISIIFPNFNGGKKTTECIDSLLKLDYPKDRVEIVMVDNGSSDGSLDAVETKFKNIKNLKIVKSPENLGAPKGYNLAIKHSNKDTAYFFKIDNDIILDKNVLKIFVKFMEKNPIAGGVNPKIYYHTKPNILTGIGCQVSRYTGKAKFVGLDEEDRGQYDEIREFESMIGCASFFRKEAIKKAGFFNPKYLVYFDDTELFIKIKKAGYKNYYLPEAKIWHNCKMSVSESYFSTFNFIRSKTIFIKEVGNTFQYLIFLGIMAGVYLPFKTITYLLKENPEIIKAQIFGFFSGLKANHIEKKKKLF